jgi:hypothetical protein
LGFVWVSCQVLICILFDCGYLYMNNLLVKKLKAVQREQQELLSLRDWTRKPNTCLKLPHTHHSGCVVSSVCAPGSLFGFHLSVLPGCLLAYFWTADVYI